MTRSIEFNREKTLESAMLLFWQQGYVSTSMTQLLDVMGIGKGSFYASFKDKRSVFVEALCLFSERTNQILANIRKESAPITAIHTFFEQTLFLVPKRRLNRGCMMVNSILELADVDEELSLLASEKLAGIEQAFEMCFIEANQQHILSSHLSPKHLSEFIMVLNKGLRVASRENKDIKELKSIFDTAFLLLPRDKEPS
jgi:TetR/AcrR family transcriptional repressor of nem operon